MEWLTFFGVSVEYFGAFRVQRGNLRSFHFGDTMEFSESCVFVSLPMILQVLQDYASPDLYTKIHSSLSILLGLRHLPCNMKHLGKRPSASLAMRAG